MAFGINITNSFVPPPPREPTDRFGLPVGWTLLSDNPVEREAALADLVREVFEVAVRHIGENRARDLFAKVAAPTRGRRRNDAPTRTALDLLAIYDARAAGLSARQLRALPGQIAAEYPTQSIEAAEKLLRRSLHKRTAANEKAERQRIEELKRIEEYRRSGGTLLDRDLLGN